jgi:hypothetical protein
MCQERLSLIVNNSRFLRACLESGRGVMHLPLGVIIAGYDLGTLSD